MASESILVQALSDLITDFNSRGVAYALAGGWAYSALVEPRATTDISSSSFFSSRHANTCMRLCPPYSTPR